MFQRKDLHLYMGGCPVGGVSALMKETRVITKLMEWREEERGMPLLYATH